jgi:DNA repair protein RadC
MKRIPLVSLRIVRERSVPYAQRAIQSAQAVFELFRALAEDLDREAVWMACLDTKNRLSCLSQVSLGSLDASLVHPREVMKIALLSNASAIILVHNHPSGDPSPSGEDRKVTDRIKQTAELFGMRFLDHVIIGDGRFYSFADEGGL